MNEERSKLESVARFLVGEIISEISGRRSEFCAGDPPRVKYFVGVLKPEERERKGEVYSKASPSTASVEFLLSAGDSGSMHIKISFDIYYRILPPFEIYTRNGFDERVYRRKRVFIGPVVIDREDINKIISGIGEEVINLKVIPEVKSGIERVMREILNDPLVFKKLSRRVDPEAKTEDEYMKFIDGLDGEPVLPEINPLIGINVRPKGDEFEVMVSLTNKSPELLNTRDREMRGLDIDNAFYDFEILVRAEGDFRIRPYSFHLLPEDYRYNREMWGIGTNCTVERIDENVIASVHTPVFEQRRYDTRNVGDTRFSSLSDDPVPKLREIERLMWEYHAWWSSEIERLRPSIPDDEYRARRRDLEKFEAEIRRFSRGILTIERYENVRRAFELLNKTYERFSTRKGFDRWKLFQLVFIVSCIPDVASREYPELCEETEEDCDTVDVLWFPTGGGKTEAYLGLVVFSAFFDRLRGKHSGTTAIMRYPLRLLSLQQLQRICEIFAVAETVRREESIPGDCFSVGFLTGQRNIPNSLDELMKRYNVEEIEDLAEIFSRDSSTKRACRVVDVCPFCGGRVDVRIDSEKYRLIHVCTNSECDCDVLPVYVIDRDVYRHLPTMIVGVQDKIVLVSSQKRFGSIFGNIYGRCPEHGFTVSRRCDVPGCRERTERMSLKDPAPSIQIQDELHLLKEELGTFESHYFGLIDYLINRNTGKRPKIIAATATIEEYENQVRHLYMRRSRRFPEEGPRYRDSFYATTSDELQRIYVGVLPVNVTHINAVVRILQTYHELIQDIERSPERYAPIIHGSLSPDELRRIIQNFYKTSVTYVLAKREGDRVSRSVDTQINPKLSMNGYRELTKRKLTGETEFKDVARLIHDMQTGNQPDMIISTSTISHGVDLENLNFMLFFGMPRMVAEYIQSSSRVGRRYPGIVICCFHPIRERDRSHYRYFRKFHEYLDRLVEPVPVNRWSKMGITRSLPGVFLGLLLQIYGPAFEIEKNMHFIRPDHVARAIQNNDLKEEEILEKLRMMYGVARSGDLSESISRQIEDLVETFFSEIVSGQDSEMFTWSVLKRYPPMRSLRDVDEQVEIETKG